RWIKLACADVSIKGGINKKSRTNFLGFLIGQVFGLGCFYITQHFFRRTECHGRLPACVSRLPTSVSLIRRLVILGSLPPKYRGTAGGARVHQIEFAPLEVTIEHPQVAALRIAPLHMRGPMQFRETALNADIGIRPTV